MVRRIPRALARAPISLFRCGAGALLGPRLMMLEHRGRTTGLPRYAALEVLEREPGALLLVSGYGTGSQWFRNVRADPRVRVWTGTVQGDPAVAEILPATEVVERLQHYRHANPRSAATLGAVLNIPALTSSEPFPPDIGETLPLVRVRRRPDAGGSAPRQVNR